LWQTTDNQVWHHYDWEVVGTDKVRLFIDGEEDLGRFGEGWDARHVGSEGWTGSHTYELVAENQYGSVRAKGQINDTGGCYRWVEAVARTRAHWEGCRRPPEGVGGMIVTEAAAAPPRPSTPDPDSLLSTSFELLNRGEDWFVAGEVTNISGRNLACVRLRFRMRGVGDRDFGVLEVTLESFLRVGQKRNYLQALPARVGLEELPAEECE